VGAPVGVPVGGTVGVPVGDTVGVPVGDTIGVAVGGIGMTPLFSIASRHYCLLVDIHFAKFSQVDEVLADLPTADNNLR
jgi:hypothetical protein